MADLDPDTPPPLIEFPCAFPIKVLGETHHTFSITIIELIQTIVPEFNANHVEMRASSSAKYISLTCTVYVISQAQLDDIYRLLSAHPMVKFTL